ncbi:MAG: sensor histidine kinase [Chthoniobacterales bacterium]
MLRRAKDAQRRLAALAVANLRLEKEIRRRYVVEAALKESERHQRQSLKKAEQMQGQLRDLSRAILDAQEEERRRISRELHDDVLQSLVGINVHLENLSRAAQLNVEQLPPKIILAQRLIAESVNSIHRFARELRPLILDDLGLLPALESYLTEFSKQTGIRVRFSAFAEVEQLSSTRRTVLYRVVQSALTNIVKHGNARQVKVSIENGKTILLKIHDNGRSFDVANILHTKSYKRLGLLGMRERVEMIGGNFSITSLPGKGTTICAEIPMMASEQKKPRRKTSIPLI